MDVLRCKTPELVRKELWTHILAYNLIRTVMAQASTKHGVEPRSISFKGALDTLRHWSAVIAAAGESPRKQNQLITEMLAAIARDPVPERPQRSEPRAKKRRAKNYQLLTRPRRQMGNLPRRNRPQTTQPKRPLT